VSEGFQRQSVHVEKIGIIEHTRSGRDGAMPRRRGNERYTPIDVCMWKMLTVNLNERDTNLVLSNFNLLVNFSSNN